MIVHRSQSNIEERRSAAEIVLNALRGNNSVLVDEAELVSRELIRVAILWHEKWHEALEEASRVYFAEHNVQAMLDLLEPLHKQTRVPETLREVSFQQAFGRDLEEAYEWCQVTTIFSSFLTPFLDCLYRLRVCFSSLHCVLGIESNFLRFLFSILE